MPSGAATRHIKVIFFTPLLTKKSIAFSADPPVASIGSISKTSFSRACIGILS